MKHFLVTLTILALFGSCSKSGSATCPYNDDNIVAPAAEIQAVQDYLNGEGITATQHSSGFFYRVETEGSGSTPGLCNQIGIEYKGSLTNGNIFDQTTTTPRIFVLGQLIAGWKKGVPLIKQGGKIYLYIPPSLGYGSQEIKDNTGTVVVPANSILVFEISLIAIG